MPTTDPRSAPQLLRVDGRDIRYDVEGTGEPVLLLHGIGRSLDDWNLVRDTLAERHTVYRVDLPGFGGSERLPARTDLAGLAAAVIAFLDAVEEVRRIRVVGNSLGGAVAMQIAATRPERVAALVLVNSAGFGREVTPVLRLIAVPGVGRRLLMPSRESARRETRGIFHDRAQVTEERVQLAYDLARRPHGTDVMLETVHALGTWRGIRPRWRRELLDIVRAHRIPTLLIWGENDLVLPAAHLAAAKAVFPEARSHLFAATGHMPQLERPDEFLEVVGEFLDTITPTPATTPPATPPTEDTA
ncbi:MAG: alpha/beta fold hydrolase [Burkholderiaceae bacterium]|nr:alpha/beta fold hydrolase [Microbacteriaceae bacterium]